MDDNKITEVNLVSRMHDCFVENENHMLVFEKIANQLLEQEKPKLNEPSVWNFFIRVLGNNSDKLSEIEREKIYDSLSNLVPDFEKLYLNNVFCISYYNGKWPEFVLHKRINTYSKIVGLEKVISKINHVYQESIQKENSVKENELLWGWVQPIWDILEKNFKDLNYELDYDKIDGNKSIIENFCYIKLLEMETKGGKKPYVGEKIKNYIEQELKNAKDDLFEDLLDKKFISSYLDYLSLSTNLDEKAIPTIKTKI